MKLGTLYGVGVGPGDPELITVKGAGILARCRHVFAPKARMSADSVALAIAGRYVGPDAQIHELIFPMTTDRETLSRNWEASAGKIADVLKTGEDACFLTLGDPLLYSTYIYMLRELRRCLPELEVITVPGITSFSAVAALTEFPIGEEKEPVIIVPAADDLQEVRRALDSAGAVVLMKIGKRLGDVLELLDEVGAIDRAVFVAHAGMENQRIETDLRNLLGADPEAGYLSIILVHSTRRRT